MRCLPKGSSDSDSGHHPTNQRPLSSCLNMAPPRSPGPSPFWPSCLLAFPQVPLSTAIFLFPSNPSKFASIPLKSQYFSQLIPAFTSVYVAEWWLLKAIFYNFVYNYIHFDTRSCSKAGNAGIVLYHVKRSFFFFIPSVILPNWVILVNAPNLYGHSFCIWKMKSHTTVILRLTFLITSVFSSTQYTWWLIDSYE